VKWVRVVFVIIVILATIILAVAWRASQARHNDEVYHSNLAQTLTVSTKSFSSGSEMPIALTCRGHGQSPQVAWDRVPSATRSFVLLMDDWDTPAPQIPLNDFTHWVLYDIPLEETAIEEAATISALHRLHINIAPNSSGSEAYVAPCPPWGKHRYTIRVYALDLTSIRPGSLDRHGVLEAMRGHIIAFGELFGVYGD
jgi:Raf kinase inhibitor-like YbhB/YbcL family protein